MEQFNFEKTKEAALNFVNNNGKCIHKSGCWNDYFCHNTKEVSKEQALKWIENNDYTFKSYWQLNWTKKDDEPYLVFCEPALSDLE